MEKTQIGSLVVIFLSVSTGFICGAVATFMHCRGYIRRLTFTYDILKREYDANILARDRFEMLWKTATNQRL